MRRRHDDPRATVVLVHGAMDRAASFGRVMRRLEEFDVVAYDRRGYGSSLHPDATDRPSGAAGLHPDAGALRAHARDLAGVLEWAGRECPGIEQVVVGHSLGGLIALIASGSGGASGPGGDGRARGCGAAGEAATVGRITPDRLCVFEAPLPWRDPSAVTSGSRAIDVGLRNGTGAAAESFYRSMVGDDAWERLGEPLRTARRAEGRALLAELVDARRPRPGLPLPARLSTLRVARGENGPSHLRRAAEDLASAAGVGCTVLRGASHGAHLQNPDAFAEWIRRSVPARRAPDRSAVAIGGEPGAGA